MSRRARTFAKISLTVLITIVVISATLFSASANEDMGATISIPSIGVDAPIVRISIRAFSNGTVSWDTTGLTSQVGFLDGMSWFGQGGNIVLGAHSELVNRVPTVFYDLEDVALGDEIIITVDGGQRRYVVTNKYEVRYTDLTPLYPTSGEQLTLLTCDTDSFNGGGYSRRVVVVATPA